MKIIIIGGTPTALTLSNLLGEEHEITIIEKDPEKAKQIAEETPSLVVAGDGSDVSVLKDAGLEQVDAIVATADDKTNLMICEIAKSEKIKKIISLVNEPKNEELFQKLGVTQLVSAVGTNVTAIKRLLSQIGEERIIAQLGQGEVQVVEQTVSKESSLIGKPTKIENASIAAIYRSGELMIPNGDHNFEEGDVVLIVAKTEDINKINDLITGA